MKPYEIKEEFSELKDRIEVLETVNFMLRELLFAENPRLERLAIENMHRVKPRNIAQEVAISYLKATLGDDHIANLENLRAGHSAKK